MSFQYRFNYSQSQTGSNLISSCCFSLIISIPYVGYLLFRYTTPGI